MKRLLLEKGEKRFIMNIFGLDIAHKNSAIIFSSKIKKFTSTVVWKMQHVVGLWWTLGCKFAGKLEFMLKVQFQKHKTRKCMTNVLSNDLSLMQALSLRFRAKSTLLLQVLLFKIQIAKINWRNTGRFSKLTRCKALYHHPTVHCTKLPRARYPQDVQREGEIIDANTALISAPVCATFSTNAKPA